MSESPSEPPSPWKSPEPDRKLSSEQPRTLDYHSSMFDKPKGLTGGQLFVQGIGGIILGIALFAVIGSATQSIAGALFIPIGVGIGLCFVPRVRGLGIGLVIALPVGALIGMGICFMSGTKF